ncbi:hypothetical protein [Mycolicibacterium holsaticum]|jgi:fructosamine-3-kinase|uniref:hypothetical protein n=1 Tax=Mycolicibacterium holsaticum TaxID=152142 RepID=UPI002699E6E2
MSAFGCEAGDFDDGDRRIRLHQLYPLLGHVVIFGGGYARQAAQDADGALAL